MPLPLPPPSILFVWSRSPFGLYCIAGAALPPTARFDWLNLITLSDLWILWCCLFSRFLIGVVCGVGAAAFLRHNVRSRTLRTGTLRFNSSEGAVGRESMRISRESTEGFPENPWQLRLGKLQAHLWKLPWEMVKLKKNPGESRMMPKNLEEYLKILGWCRHSCLECWKNHGEAWGNRLESTKY